MFSVLLFSAAPPARLVSLKLFLAAVLFQRCSPDSHKESEDIRLLLGVQLLNILVGTHGSAKTDEGTACETTMMTAMMGDGRS